MKTQSDEKPVMIQKLDSTNYAFNYNVQEKEIEIDGELKIIYEYESIVVNNNNVDNDDIIRNTINSNWDINQQLKLVNDYFAYTLGLETEEKYKTRYEDFLEFRSTMKSAITKSII